MDPGLEKDLGRVEGLDPVPCPGLWWAATRREPLGQPRPPLLLLHIVPGDGPGGGSGKCARGS